MLKYVLLITQSKNTFKAGCDVLAPQYREQRGDPMNFYVYRIERLYSLYKRNIFLVIFVKQF